MDLEFTEDAQELRRSVRDFLGAECPIGLVRQVVESGRPAIELWQAMVQLDWQSLTVPDDCGGLGLGVEETAVLAEELGRVLAPVPYLATVTQLVPVLLELGDAAQRQRFLGSVTAEGTTGALALADHPDRWGAGEVTATATLEAGSWCLRGHKYAVMGDPATTEVAVVARAGTGRGSKDLACFLVPGDDLGWHEVSALDASRPLSEVTLDGVRVGAERVLGQPGRCGPGIERAMEQATVALALETVGACDALFELTRRHALDRHQFGVPIGSFQAIKHKLTDMWVGICRARAMAYYAVAAVAEDAPQRATAVSMAKAASDDCQRLVGQEAIQTFGGIGFTWEHDAHLYVKRAKSDAALFGSARAHRLAVARALGLEAVA